MSARARRKPSPGKRTFVLLTPTIDQTAADESKVRLETATFEVPDTMLARLGMERFIADTRDSNLHNVLPLATAAALVDVLNAPPAEITVIHGNIVSGEGIKSQVSSTADGRDEGPSGPSHAITFTANLKAAPGAVEMAVETRVTPPGVALPPEKP
jgi:hypothetical protein